MGNLPIKHSFSLCDMSVFMQKGDGRVAQELTGIPAVVGLHPWGGREEVGDLRYKLQTFRAVST